MRAPATLDEVRDPTDVYPVDVLAGCTDALVLFAAGFYGRQDAVWVCDAGLTATCVDTDQQRLDSMAALYPPGWEFVTADAFTYAAEAERQWDVVSLDPPTNLFQRCVDNVPLFAALARYAVIVGSGPAYTPAVPSGWRRRRPRHRSDYRGGVLWAVLEKAEP